eukprot:TRINITY_DN25575_c0_g1_i1.p1 TRINITY_DN25575_c0_g1~~TRINITY_DN25575_c0_g1_i1.p1  ORF type:complete len:365 (+),score=83.57 TRINITY_DN25575_c0_g1_i1:77-1096(+)
MEPWAVGATLAGFMAVCFVLYTFIPESLRGRTAAVQKQTVRMWGVVDADFNWCEEDYTVPFLAELWNTVTNAFYLIPGLLGWRFHPWMPREVAAMLAVLAAIAVGSALFHGTLRYWAQLADELPMHVLVVACVYSLATRDSSSSTSPRRPILVPAIVAAEVALVAGLYATQRTSLPHLALRGWLSVTFASGFVYIFFASAATAREVDAALSGQRGWKNGAAVRLFRGAFALMVAGLFCWICDIMLCPLLHKLPFGLPYPQLHAVMWHGGSAAGVHFIAVLLILHHHAQRQADKPVPGLRWHLGAVPLLYHSFDSAADCESRPSKVADPLGEVLDKYYCS